MRGDELVEKLPCRLTSTEKAHRADDLARQLARLDELRVQKAQAARVIGESIKDVEKTIAGLSEQVRTGVERREVELAERPDYALGIVHVYRTDTGEVVRTRGIEPAERQQALFDEAEAEARRARDIKLVSHGWTKPAADVAEADDDKDDGEDSSAH